jgi:Fe-S-cluster containining protein
VKVDELEALAAEMDIQDILLKPTDLALDSGIWHSFPVPNCESCEGKCCAQRLDLRLFDIARFMDGGLDEFIEGTFESSIEYYLSALDGGAGVRQPFPYVAPMAESIYCRFLDEDHRCRIYEARMSSCRAFPLGIVKDKDENISLQWFGDQCNISSDESTFWKLVHNAILNWNEGVKNQLLLINARDQLREMGFGKYLGDERR